MEIKLPFYIEDIMNKLADLLDITPQRVVEVAVQTYFLRVTAASEKNHQPTV